MKNNVQKIEPTLSDAASNDDPFDTVPTDRRNVMFPDNALSMGILRRQPPVEGECAVLKDDEQIAPAVLKSQVVADSNAGVELKNSEAAKITEAELAKAIAAKLDFVTASQDFEHFKERYQGKLDKGDQKIDAEFKAISDRLMQSQRQATGAEARVSSTLKGLSEYTERASKTNPEIAKQAAAYAENANERFQEAGGQAYVPLYEKNKGTPERKTGDEEAALGRRFDEQIKALLESLARLIKQLFGKSTQPK